MVATYNFGSVYICIYELCFLYCLICICQNIVCSSLVEEIKNIIIIIIDFERQWLLIY